LEEWGKSYRSSAGPDREREIRRVAELMRRDPALFKAVVKYVRAARADDQG